MNPDNRNASRAWSRTTWAIVTAGVLLFLGANAHLLYVALDSRSACVPHLKEPSGEAGQFRAAQSGC